MLNNKNPETRLCLANKLRPHFARPSLQKLLREANSSARITALRVNPNDEWRFHNDTRLLQAIAKQKQARAELSKLQVVGLT